MFSKNEHAGMHIKNEFDCEQDVGFKVACASCHEIFYDLKQVDPTCPGCNSLYSKTNANKRRVVEHVDIFEDNKDEEETTHDDGLLDDIDLSL